MCCAVPAVGQRGPRKRVLQLHAQNPKPSRQHTYAAPTHPRYESAQTSCGSQCCVRPQCYIHRRPLDRPTYATIRTHNSRVVEQPSPYPGTSNAGQKGRLGGFVSSYAHSVCVVYKQPQQARITDVTVDKGSTPSRGRRPLSQNAHLTGRTHGRVGGGRQI